MVICRPRGFTFQPARAVPARQGRRRILAALALTGALPASICAQSFLQPTPFAERPAVAPPKAAPQGQPKATQPQAAVPVNVQQAFYLIRSTLLTLNDANRSGNYSVLRDLAAPGFQAKNSPADLAQIFGDLRNRHFDLFAVALLAPQLSAPPRMDEQGRLRLTGVFPTRPLQINFDLLFESVSGQWRVFGIAVATPAVPEARVEATKNHVR
jgi:hypothetical protein